MPQILKAKPVNVQVKHRGVFVPPGFDLFKQDISASIAGELAEVFNLKSTAIIVNRNAASTQYLSFRYFLPGEPFRFLDASIGVDQTEVMFSNPATVAELVSEVEKVWSAVFRYLKATVASNYFEATLHCETNGSSSKAFLNDLVNVKPDIPGVLKGFSLTSKTENPYMIARLSLDVSDSLPDGLYVVFAYVRTGGIREVSSFKELFDAALTSYRSLQRLAQIDLVEPI